VRRDTRPEKIKYKLLDADAPADELRKEYDLVKKYAHPNVMRVVGDFDADDKSYHAQFYSQVTLDTLFQPQFRSFLWQCLLDFANGLIHIHAKHDAHLDLRPSNLVVSAAQPPDTPRLIIVDFGLAESLREEAIAQKTGRRTEIGDMHYRAPEQFEELKSDLLVSPYTDMWAVGCILTEAFAGKRCWTGLKREDILTRLRARQLPPEVSEIRDGRVKKFVEQCCHQLESNGISADRVAQWRPSAEQFKKLAEEMLNGLAAPSAERAVPAAQLMTPLPAAEDNDWASMAMPSLRLVQTLTATLPANDPSLASLLAKPTFGL